MSAPPRGPAPPLRGWVEVLDELEADLDLIEAAAEGDAAALDRLAVAGTAFAPAVGGPLPEVLRERAARARRRMAELEERLGLSLRDTRRALLLAGRLTAGARARRPPSFVDTAL